MARYTSLINLPAPQSLQRLGDSIIKTLEACGLNMVYANKDYFVAKEKPGGGSLTQLTTIEVMINRPTSLIETTRMQLVVKNEELRLHQDNHCQRIFETVREALGAME